MAEDVSFRSRFACLTQKDWDAFSLLLSAEYPQAQYYIDPDYSLVCDLSHAPEMSFTDTLAEIVRVPRVRTFEMTLEKDWRAQWRLHEDGSTWTHSPPKLPRVRFLFGWTRDAGPWGAAGIEVTVIDCSCAPGNKEHYKFARRLFYLLGKVSSHRNLLYLEYPGHRVLEVLEKGSMVWVGHDARRWALEDQTRIFVTNLRNRIYRPMEELPPR